MTPAPPAHAPLPHDPSTCALARAAEATFACADPAGVAALQLRKGINLRASTLSHSPSHHGFQAVLLGGAAAGALDIVYAFVIHGMKGVSPDIILQVIASGILGGAALKGGAATAALGLALHFAMTTIMAAIFIGAARRLPMLTEQPVRWGIAYGLGCYGVMNYVVVPLSAAVGSAPPSLPMLLGGLAIHALGVGLPIALIARRFARENV